jgi:hypothetical protein
MASSALASSKIPTKIAQLAAAAAGRAVGSPGRASAQPGRRARPGAGWETAPVLDGL